MLVLSRKKNESIVINDDITIVVVEIRGDKVRLGVEAPKEVPVHRNEVYEAIRGVKPQSAPVAVKASESQPRSRPRAQSSFVRRASPTPSLSFCIDFSWREPRGPNPRFVRFHPLTSLHLRIF